MLIVLWVEDTDSDVMRMDEGDRVWVDYTFTWWGVLKLVLSGRTVRFGVEHVFNAVEEAGDV